MVDSFNRVHDYLRISLTDNCNLRCFYCMPEENYSFTPASHLMTLHEMVELARVFVAHGVTKIRLTGGEPLIRKDAAAIMMALSDLPVTLTLTTNGTRIHEFVHVLQQAQINSLNISLDTLNRQKFELITRRDQFDLVKNNIDLLLKLNFHVKVNVVVMRGLNENEITDFVEWTRCTPVHVRFIEFMPFHGNRWSSLKLIPLEEILNIIGGRYPFIPLEREPHATAKSFMVPGHTGTFAVISTMSDNFCGTCNRIRLTADGKMKNCLFSAEETDLLTAFRKGEPVVPLMLESLQRKADALGGQFTADPDAVQPDEIRNRSMITIGG